MCFFILFIHPIQSQSRRVWITATEKPQFQHIRFCTTVSNSILSNRQQLKQHLEIKLQHRLRFQYSCGAIQSLARSSTNENSDMFIKIKWRSTVCQTKEHILSIDTHSNNSQRTRNDSKEKVEIQSSTSLQHRGRQQQFLSMEDVEKQLTALEADLIEFKVEPSISQNHLLQWLASHFIVGFVTMSAGTTMFCWIIAYRAEHFCSVEKVEMDRKNESPSTCKESTSTNNAKKISSSKRTHGGQRKREKERRQRRRIPLRGNIDTSSATAATTTTTHKKRNPRRLTKAEKRNSQLQMQNQNYRIQEAVTRLQELLVEAGPWGTEVNKQGYHLITCRDSTLTLERSLELASYTQDSAGEEDEDERLNER